MNPASFLEQSFVPHVNAAKIEEILSRAEPRNPPTLFEFEAYDLFTLLGIKLPAYKYAPLSELESLKTFMQPDKKYVLKCHIPGCLHKTEIGGVLLFFTLENMAEKLPAFIANIQKQGYNLEGVIVVEMCNFFSNGMSGGELLLSSFNDTTFGPSICFGLGGTAIEYYGSVMNQSQTFLPVFVDFDSPVIRKTVEEMPCSQFLLGKIRGQKKQLDSLDQIMTILKQFAEFTRYYCMFNSKAQYVLDELEINPIVVAKDGYMTALDGVVRVKKNPNFKRDQSLLSIYEASKPLYKVAYLFGAKSVCIVGASSKNADNPATVIINKYLSIPEAVRPTITCIHPKEATMFGCKCYNSLDAHLAESKPELIILGTPAASTAQYIEEIILKNACKAVFTLAGGFAETEQGAIAEKKLRAMIAEYNSDVKLNPERAVINGPNTVGYKYVHSSDTEYNTIFLASHKSSGDRAKGHDNAALIAQSGAFLLTRISNLANRVAPRFCMSVGNQMCVTACDCLEWLLTEQEKLSKKFNVVDDSPLIKQCNDAKQGIDVYGIYIEGLLPYEGIRLMHLIARARAMGKIVIIYKAGRSKEGSSAVAGHTASMAGSYSQFAELIDLAGAVVAETSDVFEDAMYAACCLVKRLRQMPKLDVQKQYLRVSGQSNAGFERCQMADHLFYFKDSNKYMKLPDFDEETAKKLTDLFNKYKLGAVIDVQQILDTTALLPDSAYEEISTCLLESKCVDAACISLISEIHMIKTLGGEFGAKHGEDCVNDPNSVIQRYIKLYKEGVNKPWVFSTSGGFKYDIARNTMRDAGLPVFDQCDRACRALANLLRAWVGKYGFMQ
ncbi:Acyl-CoA_synthetase [Hexamita inflata]|uniref:Acyl-CoA_synthetase n=1 Tax=Hexamita inflata TaxID=28002 RepID=A0ABP1HUM6_9EUKA